MDTAKPCVGRRVTVNSAPSLFALEPLMFTPKLLTTVNNWMSFQSMWNSAASRAKVRSAVCFCDGRERHVLIAEVEGEIARSPRGKGGFHWDPLFIPKGETRTFAEMAETSLDEKLRFSPLGKLQGELRRKLGL